MKKITNKIILKQGDKVFNTQDNVEGTIIEAYKKVTIPSEPIYSFGFFMGYTKKRTYTVHQLQCKGFKNQSPIDKTIKL
jgi:hypothetical protein